MAMISVRQVYLGENLCHLLAGIRARHPGPWALDVLFFPGSKRNTTSNSKLFKPTFTFQMEN